MSKESVYELKSPFQYAAGGDSAEASFISLTAPSYKQMAHFVPLKQAFSAAINDISRDNADVVTAAKEISDSPKEEALDAATALSVIYQGRGDVTKLMVHAQELFRSGVAQVDGETPLTKALIESMSLADFEAMVGLYLADFIAPSLMGGR